MYVLGIDIRTIDGSLEDIIEVAAIVWDVAVEKSILTKTWLINVGNIRLSNFTIESTGISDMDLAVFGIEENSVFEQLLMLANSCEFIVAHGKVKRVLSSKPLCKELLNEKQWINTQYDLPCSLQYFSDSAESLISHHNFYYADESNSLFDLHRILMICAKYDWGDILDIASSPLVRLTAKLNFCERELAKKYGFHFDREKQVWVRKIKQIQIDAFDCEFQYEIHPI